MSEGAARAARAASSKENSDTEILVDLLRWIEILVDLLRWIEILVDLLRWIEILVDLLRWIEILVDLLRWIEILVDLLRWIDRRRSTGHWQVTVRMHMDAWMDRPPAAGPVGGTADSVVTGSVSTELRAWIAMP
jgi:hypothetical protein